MTDSYDICFNHAMVLGNQAERIEMLRDVLTTAKRTRLLIEDVDKLRLKDSVEFLISLVPAFALRESFLTSGDSGGRIVHHHADGRISSADS